VGGVKWQGGKAEKNVAGNGMKMKTYRAASGCFLCVHFDALIAFASHTHTHTHAGKVQKKM